MILRFADVWPPKTNRFTQIPEHRKQSKIIHEMTTPMTRGLFIVIEGLDRSGKSTQIQKTVQHLQQQRYKSVFSSVQEWSFPDRTTTIGHTCDLYLRNKQNMNDRAIHLMFSANRWEKEHEIRSLVQEQGAAIVCSRYAYSGVVYSSFKGTIDMDWCRNCDVGLPEPDIVFFLDIEPEMASGRSAYGEERYEQVSVQHRVRAQFQQLFEWEKQTFRRSSNENKICVIDASQSIEEVQLTIQREIEQRWSTIAQKPELDLLWK